MLRRFELYTLDPESPPASRERLRTAFLDASRHIPEVVHSAVGSRVTGASVDLVWEHAYESPEAYRRYMVHPFHAAVLDRYLLADSPERVVEDSTLGIGLAGYACERPDYFLPTGVRRLTFLDMRRADPGQVEAVAALARRVTVPSVSVFARNSLAAAWFDGESPLGTAPRWSHLWEQGFRDETAERRHLEGADDPGSVTGSGWRGIPGVAASLTVGYRLEPGWGYLAPV